MQDIPGQSAPPLVSFLISTHNRRDVVLHTLELLLATPDLRGSAEQPGIRSEIILIDNACSDGTAAAVAAKFPAIRILTQPYNFGACSKNAGLPVATGQFVVFLDDDSYPTPGSIRRMINYFLSNQKLGAATFDVVLLDGAHECSAYPTVFVGCGVGFRREALSRVGGLPNDFLYMAEEYDLALRLLEAGWDIRRFDDLAVIHLKTKTGRYPTRTTRLDARNNFTVITRYFPRQWVIPFLIEWMRRYRWLALAKGWRHHVAFWVGIFQGLFRALRPGERQPVSSAVFERFAMIGEIRHRMEKLAREGYCSVLFVDVGKNIFAYYLGAQASGLKVVAVADKTLAGLHLRYHGIPVISDAAAASLQFDVAIISNVSPVHAAQRLIEMRGLLNQPVIDLFESPRTIALVA